MTIEELLGQCINSTLIDLVLSNQKKKDCKAAHKIKIRPVNGKNGIVYQSSEYIGTKVFHNNYGREEVCSKIAGWIREDFKQAQFVTTQAEAHVLSGKNGSMTIKYRKSKEERQQRDLSHNRSKDYILKEGIPVSFLVDLGVMTKEGAVVKHKYDKYRQINRFLEFIEDILPHLDKEREQTIVDFGCGKSYLTFAMYYYLRELKGYDIRIIGLDLKEDVIAECSRLKNCYGYDKLDFYVGDIASCQETEQADMVVTLHACDTATDYALAKAVQWGAKVILSVPCCQHEANKMLGKKEAVCSPVKPDISGGGAGSIAAAGMAAAMGSKIMAPMMHYGILKERMAAICTDAVRAGLLEEAGYRTQVLEFIDMEHTPKNLLIRAIYTGKKNALAGEEARRMENALGFRLTLNDLMERQ